jgi:hypothetical protein
MFISAGVGAVASGAAGAMATGALFLLRISFLTAKSFLKPVIAQLKDSLILHEGTSEVLLKVGQVKHQVGARVTYAFHHFAIKKPLPVDPRISLSDAERNGVFSLLNVKVEPLDEQKARKEGAEALSDLAVYVTTFPQCIIVTLYPGTARACCRCLGLARGRGIRTK